MMVQDPVCQMEVSKDSTKFASEYMGQVYYFCSKQCMLQFEEDPESYISSKHEQYVHGQHTDGSE